jgi:homospermidine synthase
MISISSNVIFIGYGAVAKCVWNYFSSYFTIYPKQVYLIDQFEEAFYGPGIEEVNKIVLHVDANSFESLLNRIKSKEGDIIIDLSFSSSTYFFVKVCLDRGLHYLNTSIEDDNDLFIGTSIDFQQEKIRSIYQRASNVRSCILTECGQNPGLIQHYVLYALHQLYKMAHPNDPHRDTEFRRTKLSSMIDHYQIGSILMSERDQMKTSRPMKKNVLYNTWSVSGFVNEALDRTELVRGNQNPYIQPRIPKKEIDLSYTQLYEPYQNHGKHVFFLKQSGLTSYLPSIAPMLSNGEISFDMYYGQLIHHGEVFELANYFGSNAPFMSYVYQSSPYMNSSLQSMLKKHDPQTIHTMIQSNPFSFSVLDNIYVPREQRVKGFDSIGATLLCGKDSIDRIFWCGSILSDEDPIHPAFTPTIVQVAAGVLSGLSYILEPDRKPGLYEPTDLNTMYILKKAKPLLGRFFFQEVMEPFSKPFRYHRQ